jgi:hypothetical protein
MKKLLYTTAIAGLALTYATVSSAETKVSGNLGLSYFASSDDTAAATNTSLNGFGKESQLNISNSGDLNNGMKYAAGFSFEFDGGDAQGEGQTAENVYIDFISGNTTLSVGADHFQNSDRHMTNLVGFGYIGANGASQNAQSIYVTSPSNYGAYGVGLLQTTTVGKIGINYTPNAISSLATNDIGNTLTKAGVEGVSGAAATNAKSATEISFDGNLGVKGLQVFAAKKMQDRAVAGTRDLDGHRMAAKYSTGAFTIAVDKAKLENGTNEFNSSSVGVAYSLSENASIGYTRAKADSTSAAQPLDEKTDMIAIGYNLGAVSVQAQYKDVEALGGVLNNDGKLFGLYLGTKF